MGAGWVISGQLVIWTRRGCFREGDSGMEHEEGVLFRIRLLAPVINLRKRKGVVGHSFRAEL